MTIFIIIALINSKRGTLGKISKAAKSKKDLKRIPKSKIPHAYRQYRPVYKDWNLDEEIRVLSQL